MRQADRELNQQERAALSVAARMVRLGGTEAGVGAIIKLGGMERGDGLEPLGADLGEGAEALGELFGAISGRRKVRFSYRDQVRPVDPYGIAHRRGHWYLVGNTADGERMYRVDRIGDLEVGEDAGAFTKPKGFDIRMAGDLVRAAGPIRRAIGPFVGDGDVSEESNSHEDHRCRSGRRSSGTPTGTQRRSWPCCPSSWE